MLLQRAALGMPEELGVDDDEESATRDAAPGTAEGEPSSQAEEEFEEWYGIASEAGSDGTPVPDIMDPESSSEDEHAADEGVVEEDDKRDADYVPSASPPVQRRRTMGRRDRKEIIMHCRACIIRDSGQSHQHSF